MKIVITNFRTEQNQARNKAEKVAFKEKETMDEKPTVRGKKKKMKMSRKEKTEWRLLKGFGMGKSTSSLLSDIFMEDFEAAALTNYLTGDSNISPSEVILFWYRKADDTIVAIHKDHIQAI